MVPSVCLKTLTTKVNIKAHLADKPLHGAGDSKVTAITPDTGELEYSIFEVDFLPKRDLCI
jgi:hypothetical protein